MLPPKVIITKPQAFEDEIGLSSYDLALISINKNKMKCKSSKNKTSKSTYLI